MSKRRIVVTGLGIVSPLGCEIESAWSKCLNGQSGVRFIQSFDTSDFTTKFAGLVEGFDSAKYFSPKEARKSDLFIQYGVTAGLDAIKNAGLESSEGNQAIGNQALGNHANGLNLDSNGLNLDRIGVAIGSGIGGIGTIENNHSTLVNSGTRRISPFFIPGTIINMVSGHVSIMRGYRGPNLAFATACTTGSHSIGMAARCIAYGDADVMIAGGAEYASTPLGVSGFAAARALSTRNDAPEKASRPWDKDRDGFVLGDGAGVLVLEELEHAKRRGANIIAEFAGFGMSGDAFHITRPSEGGVGAALAMKNSFADAGITADDIDYVNAHSTSTPAGDTEELLSIKLALGDAAKKVAISSTKSMTGHLLGAAGAVEAIFTILALRDQVAPPTINLECPDEGCDLNLVPLTAQKRKIRVAVSNSFGFGGTNGTLVFKLYDGT